MKFCCFSVILQLKHIADILSFVIDDDIEKHGGLFWRNAIWTMICKNEFGAKILLSSDACQNGDFETAIRLYSEAIELDSNNSVLYSNRWIRGLGQSSYGRPKLRVAKLREIMMRLSCRYDETELDSFAFSHLCTVYLVEMEPVNRELNIIRNWNFIYTDILQL